MIRFLFLTLSGVMLVFAIVIVITGGMMVLREVINFWYDIDFFKKIDDWLHKRA